MTTPWKIHTADVRDGLALYPDAYFDACLTDAPYGLSKAPSLEELLAILTAWMKGESYQRSGGGFMGKAWDSFVPGPDVWRAVNRVLKPGASAYVFAGDRTHDLMGLALRLATFELRGTTAWIYGTGFPKSMNIGKAIDQFLGAEREVVGEQRHVPKFTAAGNGGFNDRPGENGRPETFPLTAPATDEAADWEGHGTALKPGFEPALLVQKALDGTYAANALKHGVAGLNVDAARLDFAGSKDKQQSVARNRHADFGSGERTNQIYNPLNGDRTNWSPSGRWPPNVVIDEAIAAALGDVQRYFYCPKPTREERDAGLEDFHILTGGELTGRAEGSAGLKNPRAGAGRTSGGRNVHPTVKPIGLTLYLASLLLPPPRTDRPRRILVPFSGSGSEMIGALLAGWEEVVGIEISAEYSAIADARLAFWSSLNTPKTTKHGQLSLFDLKGA